MKTLLTLFIALCSGIIGVVAQTQITDLSTTLTQLRQADVFRECAEFKTNLEQQIQSTTRLQGITAEQYEQLRLAYTGVYGKYDAFLMSVKRDLLSTERRQAIAVQPAVKYATLYAEVKAEYDNKFMPVMQSVSVVGGKNIWDELKAIGKATFVSVASQVLTNVAMSIQQKMEQKTSLPVINEKFYNPLRLKLWSELDIPPLAATSTNQSTDVSNTVNSASNSVGNTTYQQPIQQEAIVIPAPTFSQLSGNVSFVQLTGQTEIPINFEQRTGKDIEVVTDVPNDSTTVKDQYFNTTDAYPLGTRFKIKVSNTAFTYVLVLNSDGIKFLYPRIQVNMRSGGKDIDVIQETTPPIGDMLIPATGSFAITPSKTGAQTESEDFAMLLSKSELSVEETVEKLNAVSGNLAERITQVFGIERILANQAGLKAQGNQFSFNADGTVQNLLPIVFKIRKQ